MKPILAWIVAGLVLSAGTQAAPMRIGIETDLEPISFIDANGAPVGFVVDLLKGVSQEMKLEMEFVVLPRTGIFTEFSANHIDAIANAVYLKERESYIAFATSHLELGSTIFVRKGDQSIKKLEDLRDRRMAGIGNSRGYEYLREHGLARNFVAVATQREALHAVAEGAADATIGTHLIGQRISRDDRLANIESLDMEVPGLTYHYHVALHVGDNARLALINEGLARLRANGTYDKIRSKWIGPLLPRRLGFRDVQPYLLPALLALAAMGGAFLWQRHLLRRLASQAAALRKSEEQLKLVLEGSEDGFWDWDLRSGRVVRSERWASMLGYTLAEIEPTPAGGKKLVHPDDLPHYEKSMLTPGSNDLYALEYRMKSKSGEWRWILDRGKVVTRGPEGEALRKTGTHTDITARKRTEAALRESERLLQRSAHLLEQTQSAAHVGGWEVDLRTEQIFWTEEMFRIHEMPADFHPTLEKAGQFFTAENRPIFQEALEQVKKNGAPFDLELDLVTAGDRRIKVQVIGRAEWENDRVVKIYGSFRDITDQKKATEEREKLQLKMLEAQKLESLGVLAGGIAHDFNNLLTVILANASLARNAPAAADVADERLMHIESAAQRAGDMCRQMLAYAGKGNFVVEQVHLSTLVRDTAGLLSISIGKKSHLELVLADELPLVEADPSQLRQVVMNLLINANEALGGAAGEIRIITRIGEPERMTAGITHSFDLPPGKCVTLEVADAGCGMSPGTLARIFDPFFTTKFAGRGLGLAAVLGIVRAHHGALNVRSTLGRGTVFTLYLPIASGVSDSASPVAPAPFRTPKATDTILIADDEPAVLTTSSAVLRHYGYKTELAADGIEALKIFRANPRGFAAVLLDLTMPGLNGAEVLRAIRTVNRSVRVLLMSGYSERDVLDRLQGQRNVAILRKPFTQEMLMERLNEVITAGHDDATGANGT